jgi:chemotaxis regulatin CheY-phosphate phosphatase CheZ
MWLVKNLENSLHIPDRSMFIYLQHAMKDAQADSETLVSKADMFDHFRRLKRMTNNPEIRSLADQALNYVNFKMPHPAKLDQSSLKATWAIVLSCDADDIQEVKSAVERVCKL